jgi:hypothetical protein
MLIVYLQLSEIAKLGVRKLVCYAKTARTQETILGTVAKTVVSPAQWAVAGKVQPPQLEITCDFFSSAARNSPTVHYQPQEPRGQG